MGLTSFTSTALSASQLSMTWAAFDGLYGCIAMIEASNATTTCTDGGGTVKVVDSVKNIASGTFLPGAAEVWLCQVASEGTDDDVAAVMDAFGEADQGKSLQQCKSSSDVGDVSVATPTPTIPPPIVNIAWATWANATYELSCPVSNTSYFNTTVAGNATASSSNSTGGASNTTTTVPTANTTVASNSSTSSSANTTALSNSTAPINGTYNSTTNSTANSTSLPNTVNLTMPLNFTLAANYSSSFNLTSINKTTGYDLTLFNYSMCAWAYVNSTANATDANKTSAATSHHHPYSSTYYLPGPFLALVVSAALVAVTL